MNNSIDLTGPISFGQTFSYSFRFLKKNYIKMLPFLAIFFLPVIIIFAVALFPSLRRLTAIFNDYIQLLVNSEAGNSAQIQQSIEQQFNEFRKFVTPLLIISVFSILLSLSSVFEIIKMRVEQRNESFQETFSSIFAKFFPFLVSSAGGLMIISFIAILGKIYATPVILYTISLLIFLPALSYYRKRGIGQSVGASFILARKKLFFFFGFVTLLYILFSVGNLLLGFIGALINSFFETLRQDPEIINNSYTGNPWELLNGKSSAKTLLIFFFTHLFTAQFFLIPFFGISSTLQYFSLRQQFPDLNLERRSNVEIQEETKEEFLTDSIPL